MPASTRVHDCLINVHFGDAEQPDWMFRVKDEYFKRDDSIFGTWDMPQVLDEMDANGLNLLRPMPSLRLLQSFVADYPVACALVGPAFWGDGMYTPENAVYYPLYTKCCELDLPLCMNAGLPGPRIPGEAQNPIYFDRVCVRFPELKLCMMHGA